MAKQREIIYEPHPVSPERKAELVKAGYKIRDAAYKPADLVEPITPETIDGMKRAELVDLLAAHGVDGATGKVADLRNWAKQVMFVSA